MRRSLELWNNGSFTPGNAPAAGTFRVTVTRTLEALADSAWTGRATVTHALLFKAD